MYHVQDSLYFGRKADGSVRVLKFSMPPVRWPTVDEERTDAAFDVTLTADVWASIVAAVSHAGETGETCRAAITLHNGTS